MLTDHAMKNPTTTSCMLCCCYVEASAAATLIRYKLGKNLGRGHQGGVAKRRSQKTLFDIDMRLAGKEVPQPVQRTGELE